MFRSDEFLRALVFLGGAVFVFVVYLPGLDGTFLLDDFHNIHLAYLREWNFDRALHFATSNTSGELGRPISVVSLMFTSFFHGLDAWWFKYHNLLIHILTGIGFFTFGWKLLVLQYGESKAFWVSFLAALFWALHPLFVSTVLYPVQRMAQLSVLWTIYTCLIYLLVRTSGSQGCKLIGYWLLVPMGGLLAVFSKENGALLPLFLLLTELFISSQKGSGGRHDALARMLVILAPMMLAGVLTVLFWSRLTDYGFRDFTLYERLLTQTEVIWFYIGQIFLPRLSGMGLYLDYWPVTRDIGVGVVAALIGLLGVLIGTVCLRRVWPVFSFGICWFFAGHAIESTFIPLEMVFEHRNYLSAWGLLLVLTSLLALIPERYFRLGFMLLLIWSAGITFLTVERVGYWKSEQSLAIISKAYHGKSFRAGMSAATVAAKSGNLELARTYNIEALSAEPTRTGGYIFLLMSYCGEEAVPLSVLDNTVEAVQTYPLEIYGAVAMRALVNRVAGGGCSVIPTGFLEVLVASVRIPMREPHSAYYHLMAQVYDARGSFARASTYYKLAEDKTIELPLVTDVVATYTKFGHHIGALNYLEKINVDGRRRSAYEQKQIDRAIETLKSGDY